MPQERLHVIDCFIERLIAYSFVYIGKLWWLLALIPLSLSQNDTSKGSICYGIRILSMLAETISQPHYRSQITFMQGAILLYPIPYTISLQQYSYSTCMFMHSVIQYI